MPKTIVICSDGTGNAATSQVQSNVKRLFDRVVRDDAQIAFYDDGVGTSRWQRGKNPFAYGFNHLAELCVGRGIAHNLLELYTILVDHFETGDRLFLFGFSRGAFTVRALAGMIHVCGLLRREQRQRAAEVVRLYEGSERRIIDYRRAQGLPAAFADGDCDHGAIDLVAQAFKADHCRPCDVAFLGLWDTVKAYGWIRPRSFPALRHNPGVLKVRHAAALDERRALFQMTGWGDTHDGVEEVWFAGDHADVGGGHTEGNSALTDASLRWMLGEAAGEGLRLRPPADSSTPPLAACSEAAQAPARSLWLWPPFVLLDLLPRQELDNRSYPPARPWRVLRSNGRRNPGDHPFHDVVRVHHTVSQRMVQDQAYRPERLTRRSPAAGVQRTLTLHTVADQAFEG